MTKNRTRSTKVFHWHKKEKKKSQQKGISTMVVMIIVQKTRSKVRELRRADIYLGSWKSELGISYAG